MKAKSIRTLAFLLFFLFPFNAFAQIFGSDEENWNKVFVELKKINSRLVTLETQGMGSLRSQLENMLREIEGIKHTLPQLQGEVEQNKSETLSGLNKTNAKLDDLTAEVKNQIFSKLQQQNKTLRLFQEGQEKLKEGLAQDMEKFEQSSKTNFHEFSVANNKTLGRVVKQLETQSATTKKGFDDTVALFRTDVIPAMAAENQKSRKMMLEQLAHANTETQKTLEAFSTKNQQLNQKLIAILEESLKQGLDTRSLLDAIKQDMELTRATAEGTSSNLVAADEKINILAGSLQALQAQNTTSTEALGALKAELVQVGEFNKLADEKFNKLIDLSSKLAVHATELETSVAGQLRESAQRGDAGNTKVDLANEKLSRLIEILKAIAKEQEKLGPVATALGNMQKEQAALQKAQADFKKTQVEIKDALADLRRKANVNISRNDEIKKTLGQLGPAKKAAGGQ